MVNMNYIAVQRMRKKAADTFTSPNGMTYEYGTPQSEQRLRASFGDRVYDGINNHITKSLNDIQNNGPYRQIDPARLYETLTPYEERALRQAVAEQGIPLYQITSVRFNQGPDGKMNVSLRQNPTISPRAKRQTQAEVNAEQEQWMQQRNQQDAARKANLAAQAEARQRESFVRQQQKQQIAQANENAFNDFRNQFRAQNQARAARTNATIARQQARDAAYRQQQLAGPKLEPPAQPATQPRRSAARQSRINEAMARANREDAAIRNGTYNPRSGYMQMGNDQNQNAFGTRPAPKLRGTMKGKVVTASSKPANMRQGYKTPDGKWHEIA